MGEFFTLPKIVWEFPIRFVHILAAFALYLLLGAIAGFILTRTSLTLSLICWMNFSLALSWALGLSIFLRKLPFGSQILHNPAIEFDPIKDIKNGLKALVFAFPLFIVTNVTLEFLINVSFEKVHLPDQLAVQFLKMTMNHPFYFGLSLFTLILLIPTVEEILFRGFLQSWLRQRVGPKWAIALSAIAFASFHYAQSQGISNILVLGSLFPLAVFLGFIYEKQNSLLASTVLHAGFNTISILNLYYLGS